MITTSLKAFAEYQFPSLLGKLGIPVLEIE